MNKILWTALFAGVLCFYLSNKTLLAADENTPKEAVKMVVKSQNGLQFTVPEDWPVEERAGVVGPIPVEEYLTGKLNQVNAKLHSLERQVTSFEVRMRVLEEASKKRKTLQNQEMQNENINNEPSEAT